jgi:hypothetical protein
MQCTVWTLDGELNFYCSVFDSRVHHMASLDGFEFWFPSNLLPLMLPKNEVCIEEHSMEFYGTFYEMLL